MATSAKAHAISHELADRLKRRPATKLLALVEAVDSDANPYISLGAGVNGGANALIKTMPVAWSLAKDVLGLDQAVYSPHVIKICSEANYAATSDNVADTLTTAQLLDIVAQCTAMGCIVEWYQSLTGDAPDLADIDAANLKGTFHPDDMRPLISAQ